MRIAVSNPDSIGDFVLRQPMLTAFAEAGHELLLIVRDFVAPLAADLFPQARVLRFAANPYEPDFDADSAFVRAFLQEVREFAPELVVAAAYQYTQLEESLAASLPRTDFAGFTGYLFQPQPERTIPSRIQFRPQVSVSMDLPELEKNRRLCAAVLGETVALGAPRLRPGMGLEEVERRLERLGLSGKNFWVVGAGDIANKSVRNWYPEQWAHFCRELLAEHDIHLLFIGSPDEHETTLAIQAEIGEDASRTATITDEAVSLRALTELLSIAVGYIGRDTGPMHLAAALEKPVLCVFGGGTWPRFVPAAAKGRVFTVRVPCAGCNWLCPLERSRCVKDVPLERVLPVAKAMLRGEIADFRVEMIEPTPMQRAAIVRELYRAAGQAPAEHAKLMRWYQEQTPGVQRMEPEMANAEDMNNDTWESRYLGLQSDHKRVIRRMEEERDSVLSLIPDLRDELATVHSERETSRRELAQANSMIREIEADRAERRQDVERLTAELAACEADREARLGVINRLAEELAVSEADREGRLHVIERLTEELAVSEADRAKRADLIEVLSAELAELRNRLPIRILQKLRVL